MRLQTSRRASPVQWIWLAFLVFAAPAEAQRPDTIPGDTLRVPIPAEEVAADTLPPDSLMGGTDPDSLGPPPLLPVFQQPLPVGVPHARWEWDRQELLRFHGLSLLEM